MPGAYVTEEQCRERTDKILAGIEEIKHRLFIDDGTPSFQTLLRQHTDKLEALTTPGVASNTGAPRTWSEALKAMCVRAPYAVAAIVIALTLSEPLRAIVSQCIRKAGP